MNTSSQSKFERLRLRDIVFGYDSADYEATHKPDLLLRGFLDHMSLVQEARDGPKFLFLGYKGSGKSALGEHLKLLAQRDPELFVEFVNIEDVSFSTFSQIMKGSIEPEARYPKVWSWLLLLFILHSYSRDEGSNFTQDDELFLAVEALKDAGLLPEPNLSRAVNVTSERNFSFKISSILGSIETNFKTTTTQDLPFVIDRLKLAAQRFRSPSKHLLIIDGFDELLRRGHLQYDALGALVYEVNRLNMNFAESGNSTKIVLLCRTDLFERLPGPNKNKIRQNSAIQLDWYTDPWGETSSLIELINHRAKISINRDIDVFEVFLPQQLNLHRTNGVKRELLEYTRHLPRDMVNLFKKLQDYSGDGPMTLGQVQGALSAYSRDYLLPEITDEMDGYISGEHTELMKRILGTLKVIQPSISQLLEQARALHSPPTFDLVAVLNVLFECGAIGNIVRLNNQKTRQIFKYQNRNSSFNQGQDIIVHRGLWRGLNLAW